MQDYPSFVEVKDEDWCDSYILNNKLRNFWHLETSKNNLKVYITIYTKSEDYKNNMFDKYLKRINKFGFKSKFEDISDSEVLNQEVYLI